MVMALGMSSCRDVCNGGSCSNPSNMEDSVSVCSGQLMGGMFRQHIDNSGDEMQFDRAQVLRGIKTVMATDTANLSYLVGLQMGMSAFQTYQQLSQDTEIDKALYMKSISQAMEADSLVDLNALRQVMQMLQDRIQAEKEAREAEAAYNSPEAEANRKASEELFAQLKADPAKYTAMTDGIYKEVVEAGKGDNLDENAEIMMEYQLNNLEGKKIFGNMGYARNMKVGNAPVPVLNTILKMMNTGETAKFYVPWEAAYGKAGMPASGIGPCQSIMIEVKTAAVK